MSRERENTIDRHVGRRIKERRNALNMTQMQLGKCAGVKFQQIQKYENGSNRVGASRLMLIAEALNVPVGWFFQGLDTSMPERMREAFDERDIRLAAGINRLPDEYRLSMTNLVQALQDDSSTQD